MMVHGFSSVFGGIQERTQLPCQWEDGFQIDKSFRSRWLRPPALSGAAVWGACAYAA
jgi:hypothetical protein